MFNDNKKSFEPKKQKSGFKKITPKKDFHIVCNNDDIVLIKGVEIEVPDKYVQNLKTEGVL